MYVLKFGGTSVGSAKGIKQILKILQDRSDKNHVVVISALSGITNLLAKAGKLAFEGDDSYKIAIEEIETRHLDLISEILPAKHITSISAAIKIYTNEIYAICQAVHVLSDYSERIQARLLAYGELMSSKLVSEFLNLNHIENSWVDSSQILQTNSGYLTAKVDLKASLKLVKSTFSYSTTFIMPGFIARNKNGEITTLGRGGSDYTASVVANLLKAECIEIYSDVDGMLTASPNLVSSAYTIPHMSYEEAMELSHFGAKVLYPPTIQPALDKEIPIGIKNTFRPEAQGTRISKSGNDKNGLVKGFSSIECVALLTISGSGMMGVMGLAARLFECLGKAKINILFITQSSSEHTISLAIVQNDAQKAKEQIQNQFHYEISTGRMSQVSIENSQCIIAVVGDKMKHAKGLAGKVFKLLGDNNVNVRAIAQGSTERNISIVIDNDDERKALNVLHDGFFLSKYKKVHLYILGTGSVGSAMLKQLQQQHEFLKEKYSIDFRLMGIANSRKMVFDLKGITLENWKEKLDSSDTQFHLHNFLTVMDQQDKRNSIFIDNTASAEPVNIYGELAQRRIPVVTSNKIMASSKQIVYNEFFTKLKQNNVRFMNETNVAAGLPVLKTLEDLIASGDRIQRIEAVLSGSLNFIFNTLSDKVPFSEAVRLAREKGLTEPNPAIDLSGLDVRRKLLILARACGLQMELEDVKNETLFPEELLKHDSWDELHKSLKLANANMHDLWENTVSKGKRLRFVASLRIPHASTKLEALGAEHPAFNLDGMDNILMIYTARYAKQPLVIKGAGAGPEVTASGVFADIMRLVNN